MTGHGAAGCCRPLSTLEVMTVPVLAIDIETYSEVDLTKSGVYAYADSDSFEVLLFAYAFDDDPPAVIDLRCGERLPIRVLDALTDPGIIKTAFNAAFERTCLSKHLGVFLRPLAWQCTAVQSAMLALPLSLDGVGEVLDIQRKKLKEGADLVRYFSFPCKPTKANGGRTRNLPEHDPEKWERFKAYCVRDVEAEREIRQKLRNYPIPKDEQALYQLDQEINDRGILVDPVLVDHAVKCDLLYKEHTARRAYELTGLNNPNSVAQVREWLSEQGVDTESLDKKAVKSLLSDADGEVMEVLKLRLLMAKTSVKKYEAIRRSVCSDGRVHGLLQFYGANRTGRWCLTGDHEVLTDKGWMRLDAWLGGKIACWNPIGETVSFQEASSVCFPYSGDMYEYNDKRIAQVSTPDHRMYHKRRYGGDWCVSTVENMAAYRPSIPFTGYRRTASGMEHAYLRVLVMVQADGHYTAEGNIRLGFSKSRKVERCKSLLRAAGIQYALCDYADRSVFTVYARHMPMWLRMFQDKTFGSWLFDESADVFFEELAYWDGYRSAPNSIQYVTCNRQNADMVQAFAHITGRCALMKAKRRSENHPKWRDAYVVDIWLTPINCHEIKSKPTKHYLDGNVYCAETPTGFFLVRRNGRVWVTGNSGRLVQVQNLPQNHIPDLSLARQLVRDGRFEDVETLFDSTPNVLSELIRTAFVPKPGCRFVVADFSAIEARVIAWLSGEQWRLDVFEEGGDIYCASASQMFGIPVEKHGVNGHLRQKGKIAELALGYGGSVGALAAMGALDMGLTEEELPTLVSQWRSANPHITKLWWDVDAAALAAFTEKTTTRVGSIAFQYQSGMLFITLPSGRRLCYIKPRLQENRFGRQGLTYEGVGESKKWMRIETYGPKLVENIVQATARDLLALGMLRLRDAGFEIVMHVHDEAVVEVPLGASSVQEVCRIMAVAPDWAAGLPLRADGFECEFYQKD